MDTTETPTGNGVDLTKIGAMVTPEQEHSASVARKRRTITRKRSSSGSKGRSKTPMRVPRADGTSSSEEDDDAAARGADGKPRNGDRPKEEKEGAQMLPKEPTVDPTSEYQKPAAQKRSSDLKLERRAKPSTDPDSSSQSQDEPVRRVRPRMSRNHHEEVLRRVRAKSLPRDDVPKDITKSETSEEDWKREPREDFKKRENRKFEPEGIRKREAREGTAKRESEDGVRKRETGGGITERESGEGIRKRETREGITNRETEEGIRKREMGKGVARREFGEEIRKRESGEGITGQEFEDGIRKRESGKGTTKRESEEEIGKREYVEGIKKRESGEEVGKRECGEGIRKRETEEGITNREFERDIGKREIGKGIAKRESGEEIGKREFGEGIRKPETGEGITKHECEDGIRKREIGITKRESREGFAKRDSGEGTRRREFGEGNIKGESEDGLRKRNFGTKGEPEEGITKRYSGEGALRREFEGIVKSEPEEGNREIDERITNREELRKRESGEVIRKREYRGEEPKDSSKRNSREDGTTRELNEGRMNKTKENADLIKSESKTKKIESAANSERQSTISDTSSVNMERRGSLPKNFEEKLQKLDRIVSDNTKEIMNLLHKAKSTVEEKGKELRRRKFHKTEQKRSQSTPKQLTEAELMESFKKAQAATAEREKERIRSLSAPRRYSSGSEKSPSPEPKRPARKPYRPVVQELLKQKKSEKRLKNKIKSNKIIEILDPKTSKVIATKEMGQVAKIKFLDILRIFKQFGPRQIMREYAKYKKDMSDEYKQIANQRRRCINHLIILIIFCGLGGIIFKFTEGSFENFYKCGVKRVKRDFIDLLWIKSHNLREEEWKSLARNKLRVFEEELHTAHEAGIHSYSGQRSWSFLNGIVYCLTVVTTIGYGHLYPTTKTGQALTIVYSLIGIPLFLIILTDFGKLFTRCIKFLWSFVRRLYYTGSCKSMRKTTQVQEIFKGAQMVYELATFRRPSMFDPNMNKNASPGDNSTEQNTTAPPTPAISNYEIDDEFNLPISVAILLLVLYILLGALLFGIWEGWDFFASFYFVFISMSTIGFGDYVPRHPIFMIVSIVYLVFGLALMSMCINVVQVKLSDTFNQASAKIGATIGLGVAPEDGAIKPLPPKSVEMPQVHGSINDMPQVHGSINDINSIRSGEPIGPNTSRV